MPSAMFSCLPSTFSQQHQETYSPKLLPMMQSLLRTLVDIDFEFQRDRETILTSAIEEPLKQRAIATLQKRHCERRAAFVREIEKLERVLVHRAS